MDGDRPEAPLVISSVKEGRRSWRNSIADLSPHVAAGLAFLFPPVSGILFLLYDRGRPLVKFYALQAIVFGACGLFVLCALGILGILRGIPLIGAIFEIVLALITVVLGMTFLCCYAMALLKAFSGEEWDVPLVGKFTRKLFR
ncbi:MAG: hypothetical protein SNJ52_01960 [Verrucomicrobiia bacterium]